jgi:4-hydroxy-tetrahydrodipicolinate synthase
MLAGIRAFPLTPMDECGVDEAAFVGLVARLAQAGVDSTGGRRRPAGRRRLAWMTAEIRQLTPTKEDEPCAR